MPEVEVTFTLEEARRLLARAVDERGDDYVYPKEEMGGVCVYFSDDGVPACIAGQVLAYKGVSLEGLQSFQAGDDDGNDGYGYPIDLNKCGFGDLEHHGYVATDGSAGEYLRTAQNWQDDGYAWGVARQKAEDFYAHLQANAG